MDSEKFVLCNILMGYPAGIVRLCVYPRRDYMLIAKCVSDRGLPR